MNQAIGIDFGTTNCRAALRFEGDSIRPIKGRRGEECLVAVVAAHQGRVVVGSHARALAGRPGVDSVRSIKRLVGSALEDVEIEQLASRGSFRLAPDRPSTPDSLAVVMGEREYTPEQICSLIIKELKRNAEAQVGTEIGTAVLTVPAWYAVKQKALMQRAAESAGFKIERIVSEPLAAAIGFRNSQNDRSRETVLVYDFGGGSFKASIVTVSDGVGSLISTATDHHISGEDLDLAIANYWVKHIKVNYGFHANGNPSHLINLLRHAEKAKCELSNSTETWIRLDLTDEASFEVDFTRAEFEHLVEPYVQKSLQMTKSVADLANERAGVRLEDIDSIVLVGGCTAIPIVRRRLAEWLGEDRIASRVDSRNVGAIGAAIFGSGTQRPAGADVTISKESSGYSASSDTVTVSTLGVQPTGGRHVVIFPPGTAYPASTVQRFLTGGSNLPELNLAIVESVVGDASRVKQYIHLGLPPKVPTGTEVVVNFELDSAGALSVRAYVPAFGSEVPVEFSSPDGEQASGEQERHLLGFAELVMAELGPSLEVQVAADLRQRMTELRAAVDTGNLETIAQHAGLLEKELQDLPTSVQSLVYLCALEDRAKGVGRVDLAEKLCSSRRGWADALRADNTPAKTAGLSQEAVSLAEQVERELSLLATEGISRYQTTGGLGTGALGRVHRVSDPDFRKEPFLCSVFYPEMACHEEVAKIIACVHLETVAGSVAREAVKRFDLPSAVRVKASSRRSPVSLPRQAMIDITPDVPGLLFETPKASVRLWEDKQSIEFRFKPRSESRGIACRGWVHFWLDGVILANVPITIFVADDEVPGVFREQLAEANAKPYRLVFPSYSHQDAEVVKRLESYAAAFGDEYLRDVSRLRSGQCWSEELAIFIKQADVFQLFWSENSAASSYVEHEWRNALSERARRPDPFFLRPVYWTTEPAPIPPELKHLHFAKAPL